MAKKSVDKMTKAELVREVKRLQKQVDKLQNQKGPETVPLLDDAPRYPWQQSLPNAFEGAR